MSERKLLLDQPDRVTVKGTTEQVVVPQKSSPDQRQDESSKNEQSCLLYTSPSPRDS